MLSIERNVSKVEKATILRCWKITFSCMRLLSPFGIICVRSTDKTNVPRSKITPTTKIHILLNVIFSPLEILFLLFVRVRFVDGDLMCQFFFFNSICWLNRDKCGLSQHSSRAILSDSILSFHFGFGKMYWCCLCGS